MSEQSLVRLFALEIVNIAINDHARVLSLFWATENQA